MLWERSDKARTREVDKRWQHAEPRGEDSLVSDVLQTVLRRISWVTMSSWFRKSPRPGARKFSSPCVDCKSLWLTCHVPCTDCATCLPPTAATRGTIDLEDEIGDTGLLDGNAFQVVITNPDAELSARSAEA